MKKYSVRQLRKLMGITEENSPFAEIHRKAKEAGLDKMTMKEIDAEVQAARQTIAERKKKGK